MSGEFKESLAAHLNSLRSHVEADHEKEVLRLSRVIEGLKTKLNRKRSQDRDDDHSDSTSDSPCNFHSHAEESVFNDEVVFKNVEVYHRENENSSEDSLEEVVTQDYFPSMPAKIRSSSRNSGFSGPVARKLSTGLQHAFGMVSGKNLDVPNGVGLGVGRRHSAPTASRSTLGKGKAHAPQPKDYCDLNVPKSSIVPTSSERKAERRKSETDETDGIDSFRLASAWKVGSKHSNKKGILLRKQHTEASIHSSSGDSDESYIVPGSRRFSGLLGSIAGMSGSLEVNQEGRLSQCMTPFMVQPSSWKHVCWNMCGLVLIVYDAVIVPLEIFNPSETVFFDFMYLFATIFWTLDVLGNFFTGYMRADGSVTMKPRSIAIRYACSWLPLDFGLVTCNWVALAQPSSSEQGIKGLTPWRTLTLFRVLRILRLLKAPELEGFISEHIRSETTRLVSSIARLIMLLVLVAHFIACSWYGVGYLIASQGNASSWVERYGLAQKDIWHNYVFSLHWSLSQFTGEQIIPLESLSERTFAVVIFVFAFLFSTIFVSSITTLMTRLQIIAGKQSSQLSALRRYLQHSGISTSLAVRVLRNAQLAMRTDQRSVAAHSVELLQEISESLQVEVHFEMHFPTLAFHPFFKHYNLVNPVGLKKLCHQAVTVTWLSAHDVVFNECETPEKPAMLFVIRGQLSYMRDAVPFRSRLLRGNWACEQSLWVNVVQHSGTLVVLAESSLLSLEAANFQRIVRNFPSHHAREYAVAFVKEMKKLPKEEISDVSMLDLDLLCEQTFPDLVGVQVSATFTITSSMKSPTASWTQKLTQP